MAAASDSADNAEPTRPPLTTVDDWPYRITPFPYSVFLHAALLPTVPPRADNPARLE